MITAVFLMIILTALFLKFNEDRVLFIFGGLTAAIGLIGIGLFESTAIQFGMELSWLGTNSQMKQLFKI